MLNFIKCIGSGLHWSALWDVSLIRISIEYAASYPGCQISFPPPLYTKFYVYCRLVLVSVITSKIFRDVYIRGIFQSRFIVIIFTCDKSRNFPMVPVLSWYLPYGTCNLKIFLMLFIAILNQCCRDGANRCFPLLRLRPQFQFLPLFGHCLRHRLELFLFFVMIWLSYNLFA